MDTDVSELGGVEHNLQENTTQISGNQSHPEVDKLHVDDWRNFDKEEKKKLVDFVRKKFSIPRRGEAYVLKSLGKKWKDYKCELRDKAKRRSQSNRNNRANQKMPHTGGSKSIATLMDEQAVNGIEPTRAQVFILTYTKRKDGRPLDDDSVKAIVFGNDKSGYVRGLGLGPTPSGLWGSKSSLENIIGEDSSNEAVQRLTQEITELKDKHNEEMNLMKQN
ncbi:uncharacterized protein [Nicotiana sylvestris]|uniref:uncharacterized protein n=1 Tax=Nicotiana sylvestris TaxID=4096 RepID=UPI00388C9088